MNSFSQSNDPKLSNEELGRKSVDEFKKSVKSPLIIVLDNIRSLHNVGSVFRTSDAFAINSIYLCGITAQPPHREIYKTALGATESVEWKYFENTMDALQEIRGNNYKIYSVEQTQNSIALDEFQPNQSKIALIFGHEVKGVQQEIIDLSDGCLEIPQLGTKHSFNISVSCGIVLWDIYQKIKALKK